MFCCGVIFYLLILMICRVCLVRTVSLEILEAREEMVTLVSKVYVDLPDCQEVQVHQGIKGRKVQLDLMDNLVTEVHPDNRVNQEKEVRKK